MIGSLINKVKESFSSSSKDVQVIENDAAPLDLYKDW
jgi:hypothetical protein